MARGTAAQASNIGSEDRVVFFPTAGRRDGSAWELSVHGWVYRSNPIVRPLRLLEPRGHSKNSRLMPALRNAAAARMLPFIADNRRGRVVRIELCGRVHALGPSRSNGHFTGRIHVPLADVERCIEGGPSGGPRVCYRAVLPPGDDRELEGDIHLVEPEGLSVVSDIDDTIKLSQAYSRASLLYGLLFQKLTPISGMCEVYDAWSAAHDARFHYVTASAWQLYAPLSDFMQASSFPDGTFHMKFFRWKDRSFWNAFTSPRRSKTAAILTLLLSFPSRRFVLVGDSGQSDPEIYAHVARRYPDRVAHVFIRDLERHGREAPRFQAAFGGLRDVRWDVFSDPAELPRTLDLVPTRANLRARGVRARRTAQQSLDTQAEEPRPPAD
jgi:hypothetical protein